MTYRYTGRACPACGSQPLLDSRSSRSHYFCPACTRFFDTDLREVRSPEMPVSESERRLMDGNR